jgi:hypothetical protein
MRPIIDVNNLSYSKEIVIYYTRTNILLRILLLIGLAIGVIYYLNDDKSIISLVLAGIFLYQIPYLIKSIKRINEVQFRINGNGIQYQNESLVPWSNIENERTVTEYKNHEDWNHYFIYYIIDPGQVMKFDLEGLNIGKGDLQHALTLQRNRFKKENNIR